MNPRMELEDRVFKATRLENAKKYLSELQERKEVLDKELSIARSLVIDSEIDSPPTRSETILDNLISDPELKVLEAKIAKASARVSYLS